jgi:hypothetical protein
MFSAAETFCPSNPNTVIATTTKRIFITFIISPVELATTQCFEKGRYLNHPSANKKTGVIN